MHAAKPAVEEVNFWKPSPTATFKALSVGEPLLFKLHSPRNFIVGGGFFTKFVHLPLRPTEDDQMDMGVPAGQAQAAAVFHRGGDGLIREIELLAPSQVTLLADRRITAPYGVAGGSPGQTGQSILIENHTTKELPSKCNVHISAGSVLRIETPGGGGW